MVRKGASPLLGAAISVMWGVAHGGAPLVGTAEVVDGDTLRIADQTVRLHAIDAPEAGQICTDASGEVWPCGDAATHALRRIATGPLTCAVRGEDRYGRTIATCKTEEGADVGAVLVRAGMAFADPTYGTDYVDAEKEALFAGRGVWQGEAERPSTVRATRATAPPAAPPGPCRIKGNISGNGMIYHMPGQVNYDVTWISEARGERWFCSEAEARAAGWRRARR